ncbi:MAG: Gfo/Idh/MocA family oxidoreductase [Planctomycetota bacterium]|jgi:predicted dehydrogenase
MKAKNQITRRNFLKSTAAVTAAFTIVPRYVLGGDGYTPPSEILNHAIIGVGGMGQSHINYVRNDSQGRIAAICDVDKKHLDRSLEKCGKDCKGYRDFREVIGRDDIDIVHIVTPPHWHGLMSIAAAEAGKDIWCEKPMTRTIAEGEKVVEAVRKNGRIFRINTYFRFRQGFYCLGKTVSSVKKLVDSGLLGWPLKVNIGATTGFALKLGLWQGQVDIEPKPIPEHLDYDMWLGPAPVKAYNPHRVHANFRGYWDYDGGGLGDMGQHYLDPVQYFLGKDNESPAEIEVDTIQQHPDAVKPWRRIKFKYNDGCEIMLDGEGKDKNIPYIEGPKGKLFSWNSKFLQEVKGYKSDIPDLDKKLAAFPEPEPQLGDFNKAVRTRSKFALNEENGHRSCTLVNLGVIAVRLGRKLYFDSDKQRFIGDEQANRLAEQPMRAPWHL